MAARASMFSSESPLPLEKISPKRAKNGVNGPHISCHTMPLYGSSESETMFSSKPSMHFDELINCVFICLEDRARRMRR